MSELRTTTRPTLSNALLVVGGLLAVMWVLEIIDSVTLNALDAYGIEPRQASDLLNIFVAPFLHYGWAHLISNSIPFLVLGVLVYLGGRGNWAITTLIAVVTSGLAAWLMAPTGSITAGASGVVFGWLTYLLARGWFTRKPGQIAVAVIVFLLYGGVLLGVLPGTPGVSWQAHLGGAVGGALAAWWLHDKRP
ncbi:MAG TPA: rhomboid family intramembrane serine protease [Tessaracoccus flavescens]|uniref:Rhomboid family intramembrane serine protease n=1 Tax=Tessaracoccus flavescens TaxID=399497 RepID=A0A921JQF4_9ACTN|nr:rhomboid family intramembrane serine protease [Tessaracoccus flavescens]